MLGMDMNAAKNLSPIDREKGIVVTKFIKLRILNDLVTKDHLQPKTAGSAGIDLMALCEDGCDPEPCIAGHSILGNGAITLEPGQVKLIRTGIAIHIEHPGYAGMILPRSGSGHRGLVLGNLVGLIDSDYQGELKISAWNRSNEPIQINRMDRIAQLVIVPVMVPEFTVVDSFGESARGDGGFGSTGS